MVLDISSFPLIWLRSNRAKGQAVLSGEFSPLDRLLERGKPIVFLSEAASFEEHDHCDEHRLTPLWLTRCLSGMEMIKGMVIIEPAFVSRQTFEAFAFIFEAFCGYPILMAASRDEALSIAHKLLRRRTGSAPLPALQIAAHVTVSCSSTP